MDDALYTALTDQHTTSPFGGKRVHQGRDSRAKAGTPVYAAHDGGTVERVSYTDRTYGYVIDTAYIVAGRTIIVRTGHLSRILVVKDQRVWLWTQLAESGGIPGAPGSGVSEGEHLHEGVLINGVAHDPADYLNSRPKRHHEGDTMQYFQITDSAASSLGVKKDDWWCRRSAADPLQPITTGQLSEAWRVEGVNVSAPFEEPNISGRSGAWFLAAIEEDKGNHARSLKVHVWQEPVSGAAFSFTGRAEPEQ